MARAADYSPEDRALLDALDRPERVQQFLDETAYSEEPLYRCPRRLLHERRANCVDGAVLAAAALRHHGHLPLLLDLRAVRDDDHVIALFRRDRHWGAVAKSNVVGLRFREPVFRTLRELALSYFELYFNLEGEKTLRSYSCPFDLGSLDALGWEGRDEVIEAEVCPRLDALPHTPLLTPAMIERLVPVDRRSFDALLSGANPAGLWRNPPGDPEKKGG